LLGVTYKSYGPAGATSWSDATVVCETLGMQLVTVDNAKRAADLHSQMVAMYGANVSYWLGASDAAVEGNWTWVDKRTWSTSYLSWASGEPSNTKGDEDCLVVRPVGSSAAWHATSCNSSSVLVCQPPSSTLFSACWLLRDYAGTGTTTARLVYLTTSLPTSAVLTYSVVTVGGLEYSFYSASVNWTDASAICTARGLALTTVSTQQFSDDLHAAVKPLLSIALGYWLGGNDIQVEGKVSSSSVCYSVQTPDVAVACAGLRCVWALGCSCPPLTCSATNAGTWTWADGRPWSYTRWGAGEGIGATEDCLLATSSNYWIDHPCSQPFPFVCGLGGESLASYYSADLCVQYWSSIDSWL
jgi:hypothetical protein